MLELWRIRAILADLMADLPGSPYPDVGAIEHAIADLAGSPWIEVRQVGVARDGTPIRALGIAPPEAPAAPGVLVVGVPRGDAPSGAGTILALARHLSVDPALCAALGVRWWLIPCAAPADARQNAAWWPAPRTIEGYARGIIVPPLAEQPDASAAPPPPEQRALRDLIAAERPQLAIFLYDAPSGGLALRASQGLWHGREGDFARLLDPLGLPLDHGGALGPPAAAIAPSVYPLDPPPDPSVDPYERFRADLIRPVGAALRHFGPADLAVGVVVSPLFVDYARREHDRTLAPVTRRAVAAEGIRLWREWFAFGRTALDLIAPSLAVTDLADSPAHRALLDALRGADTILAEGLRWPAFVPDADAPATIAATFAHGDAIRLARLARLATLIRILAEVGTHLPPIPPETVAATLDRARETQTRWIDELAAPGHLRPPRPDHILSAQLGALLLALS